MPAVLAAILLAAAPCVAGGEAQVMAGVKPVKEEKPGSGKAREAPPHLFKPIKWGCNDDWSLQFGGETRLRWERQTNYDMDRRHGDNDNIGFLKTKLNMDLRYRETVRAYLEILDARVFGERTEQKLEDEFDVHQAFLEFCAPKDSPLAHWSIRGGRQEMIFGEKRLVDSSGWSNLPRTYDGVRVMHKSDELDLDMFVVQPDYYDTIHNGLVVSDRKRPQQRTWFYGVNAALKCAKPHEMDLYYFGLSDRHDKRTFPSSVKDEFGEYGTQTRHTVGTRLRGPVCRQEGVGELGYGFEAAYQFGNKVHDDVKAHMVHGDLNYKFDCPWKPKLVLEGNLASGDDEALDGETNTFNPLFGTTSSPYGIIDFVRLQNMRELAVLGSVEPTSKLKAQLEYHWFWLDSPTDSWVNSRGTSLGRDKLGKSGRELGQELDFIVSYKATKWMTVEGGAAHFFQGGFAGNQGYRDGANFLYLQTKLTF